MPKVKPMYKSFRVRVLDYKSFLSPSVVVTLKTFIPILERLQIPEISPILSVEALFQSKKSILNVP